MAFNNFAFFALMEIATRWCGKSGSDIKDEFTTLQITPEFDALTYCRSSVNGSGSPDSAKVKLSPRLIFDMCFNLEEIIKSDCSLYLLAEEKWDGTTDEVHYNALKEHLFSTTNLPALNVLLKVENDRLMSTRPDSLHGLLDKEWDEGDYERLAYALINIGFYDLGKLKSGKKPKTQYEEFKASLGPAVNGADFLYEIRYNVEPGLPAMPPTMPSLPKHVMRVDDTYVEAICAENDDLKQQERRIYFGGGADPETALPVICRGEGYLGEEYLDMVNGIIEAAIDSEYPLFLLSLGGAGKTSTLCTSVNQLVSAGKAEEIIFIDGKRFDETESDSLTDAIGDKKCVILIDNVASDGGIKLLESLHDKHRSGLHNLSIIASDRLSSVFGMIDGQRYHFDYWLGKMPFAILVDEGSEVDTYNWPDCFFKPGMPTIWKVSWQTIRKIFLHSCARLCEAYDVVFDDEAVKVAQHIVDGPLTLMMLSFQVEMRGLNPSKKFRTPWGEWEDAAESITDSPVALKDAFAFIAASQVVGWHMPLTFFEELIGCTGSISFKTHLLKAISSNAVPVYLQRSFNFSTLDYESCFFFRHDAIADCFFTLNPGDSVRRRLELIVEHMDADQTGYFLAELCWAMDSRIFRQATEDVTGLSFFWEGDDRDWPDQAMAFEARTHLMFKLCERIDNLRAASDDLDGAIYEKFPEIRLRAALLAVFSEAVSESGNEKISRAMTNYLLPACCWDSLGKLESTSAYHRFAIGSVEHDIPQLLLQVALLCKQPYWDALMTAFRSLRAPEPLASIIPRADRVRRVVRGLSTPAEVCDVESPSAECLALAHDVTRAHETNGANLRFDFLNAALSALYSSGASLKQASPFLAEYVYASSLDYRGGKDDSGILTIAGKNFDVFSACALLLDEPSLAESPLPARWAKADSEGPYIDRATIQALFCESNWEISWELEKRLCALKHGGVLLGKYVHGFSGDSDAEERDICWRKICDKGDSTLLISEFALDYWCADRNSGDLESWLQGEFAESAGLDGYKNGLLTLRPEEIETYLPLAEDRICLPTLFAYTQESCSGAVRHISTPCPWWLASVDKDAPKLECVTSCGEIQNLSPQSPRAFVRPALWIDSNAYMDLRSNAAKGQIISSAL